MNVYIALFRGLNVGGSHKTPMADLRAMLEELGHTRVETYIQSGNAVFEAAEADAEAIALQIEAAFAPRFGFDSPTVVRTLAQWRDTIAACPYAGRADAPKHVHVGFFRGSPDAHRVASLADIESGADEFAHRGMEIYLSTPDGLGRSKLGAAVVARSLGASVTLRNWRTVLTLEEMARH
jgi:uncharacterized protein (DUF1697 family)